MMTAFAHSNVRFRRFPHHTGGVAYTPPQLAAIYGVPAGADGKGKTIGFLELGGGFIQADLNTYFNSMGLSSPLVQFVSVDGGTNSPGNPTGPDSEVMLDLCVAIGVANAITPIVYMAPNTEQGFVDSVQKAIADGVDALSISWGAPEDQWSSAGLQALSTALALASSKGIAVTAAAGDNGSSDGEPGTHVDFPSSSPYALACGGTTLVTNNGRVTSETVWNDGMMGGATGGGVSTLFALPPYQSARSVPGGKMRGVPDVAADADPQTGITIIVDGQMMVLGGTSAVAPFWAAVIAITNQQLGKRWAPPHPFLYASPGCFRDITIGNNGVYVARAGWDPCTGLGSPDVGKLLRALAGQGNPPPVKSGPTITLSQALAAGTYQLVAV